MAALESQLGIRLFQRSTRQLAMTEAGTLFAQRLGPLLDEFQRIRHMAADSAGQVRGTLRISASNTFGLRCIVPLLPAFCREHPELQVELTLTDTLVDLVADRIDVAVRSGALQDSTVVALPLLQTRYRAVAAAAWVREHGRPRKPQDLQHCDCLTFALPGFRDRWIFEKAAGSPKIVVEVSPRVLITNGLALRECVLAGLGVSLLPDWLIDEDIAAGRLVDLFPRHRVALVDAPTGLWFVYPSRSYVPAKVRAFIDFVRQAIGDRSGLASR